MKKTIVYILLALSFMGVSAPGYANMDNYKARLKDGFEMILTSPKPFADSFKKEYSSSKRKPFGVVEGFFKGSFHAVKQLTLGFCRVLTFNVGSDNFVNNMLNKEGSTK